MSELIETLPVVALRGMTILPDMVIHFDVSRERSVKAIEEAMLRDQRVFLVTQKDVQVDNPGPEEMCIRDRSQALKIYPYRRTYGSLFGCRFVDLAEDPDRS